jgi:methyl-accepting chemotaxis protein
MLVTVAVAVAVAVLVGVLALSALSDAAGSASSIYTDNVSSITALAEVQKDIVQARVDVANQLISIDAAGTAEYTQAVAADFAAVQDSMKQYRATRPAADVSLINTLDANYGQYMQLVDTKQLGYGRQKNATSPAAAA